MRFTTLALTLSLLAGPCVAAQQSIWRDSAGKPMQETESMRSRDGFAGAVIATTDVEWAKQGGASGAKPAFARASAVPYGMKVYVLMFFANPLADAKGQANVRCDYKMTDPNRKVTLEVKDAACYAGPAPLSTTDMRLSEPVITFVGDPGDPAGEWVAEVVLRDTVRRVEVPLRTTFTLK